jgi:hypothetical protein
MASSNFHQLWDAARILKNMGQPEEVYYVR